MCICNRVEIDIITSIKFNKYCKHHVLVIFYKQIIKENKTLFIPRARELTVVLYIKQGTNSQSYLTFPDIVYYNNFLFLLCFVNLTSMK